MPNPMSGLARLIRWIKKIARNEWSAWNRAARDWDEYWDMRH